MSRGDNWVALDKNLAQAFRDINRPFSLIEAMFSYSIDIDNGVEGTISGYSKLWGWSRNKVRRFIKDIRTDEGHLKDSKRTHAGHPIHFIDKGLWRKKDSKGTGEGQERDRSRTTTSKPNPNPNSYKLPKGNLSESADSNPRSIACPYKKIRALYNQILGDVLPQCRVTNKTVDGYLKARWSESSERQNLEWWEEYFQSIRESSFLTGRSEGSNGKPPFRAFFEWIVKSRNMSKILDGNYADRDQSTSNREEQNQRYKEARGWA